MHDEAEARDLMRRHGLQDGLFDEESSVEELLEIQKDLGLL